MDKDDLVFLQMLVHADGVAGRHVLHSHREGAGSQGLRIHLDPQRLAPLQHPTFSLLTSEHGGLSKVLPDYSRRTLGITLNIWSAAGDDREQYGYSRTDGT